VNRFDQPGEELGIRADWTSPDLKGVLEFMLSHAAARHSDVQLK
jgi:hypothetical protein